MGIAVEPDEDIGRQVRRLRELGYVVFGPSVASRRYTMAARGAEEPLAGFRCQIGAASRWVQGYGPTPDAAIRDAMVKMAGYRVDGSVRGG